MSLTDKLDHAHERALPFTCKDYQPTFSEMLIKGKLVCPSTKDLATCN